MRNKLPSDWFSINKCTEEVILAEERTTEEEKMHIMEGKFCSQHIEKQVEPDML